MSPRRSLDLILLVGSVMILAPAFGQRGGSSSSPPAGGGTPPGGGATQPGAGGIGQSPTQGTQPAPTLGQSQPIFISGRILLDDGTPPPQPVPIQRVCSGSPYTEGYTNGQGYFSIRVGVSAELQDASNSGHQDPRDGLESSSTPNGYNGALNDERWRNCEIRAQLAGYQSQSVSLLNRRAMDDPNVGTLFLRRLGQSEGTMVSATELAAPKSARKAYEKGLELIQKKKLDDAQASFTKAVEEYPRYAAAWAQLGSVAADKGDPDAARHAFEQSIGADPKYVVPYVEMSQLEVRARHWKEGAEISEKAFRLDPFNYPQAYFFNAVAHYNLRQLDAAEESARRAEKLDTRHQIPQISHLIGTILADRHDYKGAAAEMRDYLKLAPEAQDAAKVRSQLEQFDKLIAAAPAQATQ